MMRLGVPELLIVLTIVVVLFGAGRISGIGRELGDAIRNFRQGLNSGKEDQETPEIHEVSANEKH